MVCGLCSFLRYVANLNIPSNPKAIGDKIYQNGEQMHTDNAIISSDLLGNSTTSPIIAIIQSLKIDNTKLTIMSAIAEL